MKTLNDYMREHSGGSSIDYNAMLEDINRLREALSEVLTEALVYNGVQEFERIGDIARAALEEK